MSDGSFHNPGDISGKEGLFLGSALRWRRLVLCRADSAFWGTPFAGDRRTGHYPGRSLMEENSLQSAICNTPMPDIYHGHFAVPVQHLADHAVIADTDPVKVFCAGEFVCFVGNRFTRKILNMLKNMRDDIFRNFPEILFSALLKSYRIRIHEPVSHHAFFQLGKIYRTFVTALSNHGKIMKIFLEVLVFRKRKDDRDLVAVLVNYILFNSSHENS